MYSRKIKDEDLIEVPFLKFIMEVIFQGGVMIIKNYIPILEKSIEFK